MKYREELEKNNHQKMQREADGSTMVSGANTPCTSGQYVRSQSIVFDNRKVGSQRKVRSSVVISGENLSETDGKSIWESTAGGKMKGGPPRVSGCIPRRCVPVGLRQSIRNPYGSGPFRVNSLESYTESSFRFQPRRPPPPHTLAARPLTTLFFRGPKGCDRDAFRATLLCRR